MRQHSQQVRNVRSAKNRPQIEQGRQIVDLVARDHPCPEPAGPRHRHRLGDHEDLPGTRAGSSARTVPIATRQPLAVRPAATDCGSHHAARRTQPQTASWAGADGIGGDASVRRKRCTFSNPFPRCVAGEE